MLSFLILNQVKIAFTIAETKLRAEHGEDCSNLNVETIGIALFNRFKNRTTLINSVGGYRSQCQAIQKKAGCTKTFAIVVIPYQRKGRPEQPGTKVKTLLASKSSVLPLKSVFW